MIDNGWMLGKGEEGPTWERERDGRRESRVIDFFISHGQDEWHKAKKKNSYLIIGQSSPQSIGEANVLISRSKSWTGRWWHGR